MPTHKIQIHNALTGEITERDLNAAELAQAKIDENINSENEAKSQAKALAKSALLEKLGITAEEAALLLS